MKLKDFNFLFALLALTLFDALFGGALAAILQHEGWKQRVNDLWQVGFGTVCALTIGMFFLIHRAQMRLKRSLISNATELLKGWFWDTFKTLQDARWQAIYLLGMLLTYSEDILFYIALWGLNWLGVTKWLSGGFEYQFPQYFFPWSLSGWFGFITRWIFGETVKIPTVAAMLFSLFTFSGILVHINYRKDKAL